MKQIKIICCRERERRQAGPAGGSGHRGEELALPQRSRRHLRPSHGARVHRHGDQSGHQRLHGQRGARLHAAGNHDNRSVRDDLVCGRGGQ